MAETAVVSGITLTTSISTVYQEPAATNGSFQVYIANISGATRYYDLYLRADATLATSADAITGIFTQLGVSTSQLLPLALPALGTLQGRADAASGVVVKLNGVNVT